MSLIQGSAKGDVSGFYPKEIEQSLRFNDNDSAYLSWTPASAGNRKTWTFSTWVKRGAIATGSGMVLFGASGYGEVYIDSTDNFRFYNNVGSTASVEALAVARDASAWYHVVCAVDTTQATSSNRVKLYINGEQVTALNSPTYPAQNSDLAINNTNTHYVGAGNETGSVSYFFDGYLAETHFIDGTAYDATAFGEFKNGVWVAKEFAGTYGTNGFYLPFSNDYTVEGFSTVTYEGTSSYQYIGGVGFEPDLVWFKSRDGARAHVLIDSVRGVKEALSSGSTDAEYTEGANNGVMAFNTDGFTIGNDGGYTSYNSNGESTVAWCWDAGTGSPVSNTDGSITSTVKANPSRGFSIVSYTGTGSAGTLGHGLSSAPEMIIVKSRTSGTANWITYSESLGNNKIMLLNLTDAAATSATCWNNTSPTSSVFTVGTHVQTNNSGDNFISYCFHSVSGYSKMGSYTGNGASGNTVTTGFKPAFVMIKRTDVGDSWAMYDNVRDLTGDIDDMLYAERSDAEAQNIYAAINFTDTGFSVDSIGSTVNNSGGTYIYMAFADTREAAFWLDDSGNNNDWENNGLTESDISLDSPTNNFATINVLSKHASGDPDGLIQEGNLRFKHNGSSGSANRTATFRLDGGTYYVETYINNSVGNLYLGLSEYGKYGSTTGMLNNATTLGLTITDGSAFTYTTGDIIGISYDVDNTTVKYYKNGTYQFTATHAANGEMGTWVQLGISSEVTYNFGQDSSFAGNKVPQGYTDANGRGDFYYAPPAGYLALCTANLPEPAIGPNSASTSDEHFNVLTYTNTTNVTGVGFAPDLVWHKSRNQTYSHYLYDKVRGTGAKGLNSDTTNAEGAYDGSGIVSFDSDGVTYSSDSGLSETSAVGWFWKANGSGVSNTDGSITSTVSANVDAGFSIVSATCPASGNFTVGHGLSQAPEMVIVKDRDASFYWPVYHASTMTSVRNYLRLEATNAQGTSGGDMWGSALPTSTVVGLSTGNVAAANNDFIAYCFHSVEGFSKMGSYTGNGSTDGPFVYTGFRPAFVMVKNASASANWMMLDNHRSAEYNPADGIIYANSASAENGGGSPLAIFDFTANGFKLRGNYTPVNASGNNYIYMAFAEMPAKYSLSR